MSAPGIQIKKRKRRRPIISCAECHRRKQKCDRQLPCGNCILRSASHLCQYQTRAARPVSGSSSLTNPTHTTLASTEVSGSFGYIQNQSCSGVEILEKLDLGCETWRHVEAILDLPEQAEPHTYNRIITTIPPRPYTMLLVKVFFAECNWMYGSVHSGTFYQLLEEWYDCCTFNNLPVPSHVKSGHSKRRQILSQFPSLLLQVLAVALQMLPREHYKQMSQLNILGKEDFRTLSTTYSNSACELASLLASNQATLPRVQQWFLRASWLKSEGRAIEAWHALGQAIREAQELGLHKEHPRSDCDGGGTEGLAALWQREIRKRVWVNLYVWDRFMAMILGRPTLINDHYCTVTLPVDCDIPVDLTRSPPVPRGPTDPPSTFTQRLTDYQLSQIINEIEDLQLDSAKAMPLDVTSLERIHAKIQALVQCFPPSMAVFDRDTSHDSANPFLRAHAAMLKCTTYCIVVALHRPFVFTRQKSRIEIVKAGILVLEAQKDLLDVIKTHLQNIFTLHIFTFDPAVLIATVIITAPLSLEPELLDTAIQYISDAHKRMEILGRRVKLAEKSAAVLGLLVKKAESSRAVSRVSRNLSSTTTVASPPPPPPPASHTPTSALSTTYMNEDRHWLQTDFFGGSGVGGVGPINMGILLTRELDEILTFSPGEMTMGGMEHLPMEFGLMDSGFINDGFW